jgi:signal transduction histidine kinase
MILSLIFCFFTLAENGGNKSVSHIIFDEEFNENWTVHHATLYGSVYYLEDMEQLSAEEAYEKFSAGEFNPIAKRAKFNKGYQSSDWWFALRVENSTEKEQLVTLSAFNAAIFKVDFFEYDAGGNLMATDAAGYSIPGMQRRANARNDYTTVNFPPKSKRVLMMKIDFNGGRSGTVFYLTNYQMDRRDESWRAYYLGHMSGIYTAVVAISLLGFLFFRKKVYLFLSGYSIFGLILTIDIDRILLDLLGIENYLLIGAWIFPISILLFTTYLLLFTIQIFKVYGKKIIDIPWIPIFANLQFVLVALLIVANFLYFEPKELVSYFSFCHYVGFANLGLIMVFCGLQVKRNPGLIAFVFSANFLVCFVAFLVLFTHLGNKRFLPIEMYLFGIGLLLNLLIIVIGLVYQYFSAQEEKTRLLSEQSETEKEILRLSIEAQEKERQRIAKDLHDDLGSNLAMIKLRMELLMENQSKQNGHNQSLEEIHNLLDGACKDLRYISHELMPVDLSTKVMRTMVEELVEKLSVQRKVAIHAQVDDIPILSIDTKVNLFRIIKELMNNILKHAQASEANIHLFQVPDSGTITLEISDNGKGIPNEVLEGKSKGMGLKNLEKRVEYLKGKLNIQSSGLGTLVKIEVPLASKSIGL